MVGGYLNQLWDGEESLDHPRYLPLSDAFSEDVPDLLNPQITNDTDHYPVQFPPDHQFVHPQELYHHSPLLPFSTSENLHSHIPVTSSSFQDPFNRAFISHQPVIHEGYIPQPVVHEGYIPAPGVEDEDDYPTLPAGYRDTLFQDQDLSSSSDESEFERRIAEEEEEEELRELTERDNPKDADYSEDEQHDAVDPDEDLELDEFEDVEDRPRRGKGSRGRGRGRGMGRGRGGFRGSASGRGRKGGKPGRPKGRRGPRPTADPGPEFRELQRSANERFIAKDYTRALEYGQKAVQLNPEIFDAHNIVSEIYAAMGEELKSIESLIIGAPTKRDAGLWHFIIERIKKLDTEDHPNYTEDVKTAIILQCLKSIIQLDVTNYEARSLKLEIEARLGHVSKSVNLGSKMLKMLREQKADPDTEVLKIMAMMGTSTAKHTKRHLDKIIESFDESIEVFTGPHRDPTISDLDWELINIYLDLLDRTGKYDYALLRLKTLSRWAQGRRNETYWDEQKDDREFDLEDEPRRVEVFDFSRRSQDAKYGESLPMEIRVKMGLFRLRRSPDDYAEAMVSWVLPHLNVSYPSSAILRCLNQTTKAPMLWCGIMWICFGSLLMHSTLPVTIPTRYDSTSLCMRPDPTR
jgi:general transcription factor 3C polypeptide 3 (transcription factor C subunit 4)